MKSRLVYFLTLAPVNKIITQHHNCALSNFYRILCARLDPDGTSIPFSPTLPRNKHLEIWSLYVHVKGSVPPHDLRKITSKVWVAQKFPYVTPVKYNTRTVLLYLSDHWRGKQPGHWYHYLGNPDSSLEGWESCVDKEQHLLHGAVTTEVQTPQQL